MKVKTIVKLDQYEREFEVSCGVGDKSFKWLAMVACQRFSLAAPNGALRRRDNFRGLTERAQNLPFEIYLSSGEIPHPASALMDYLNDGDEVFISLSVTQNISPSTVFPTQSKWSTLAFSTSDNSREQEESEDDDDVEDEPESNGPSAETMKADADFMRLILSSQMTNTRFIAREMNSAWVDVVQKSLPNLDEDISNAIFVAFRREWDILLDLFQYFAPDGKMTAEQLQSLFDEAGIFTTARELTELSARVHRRTCWALAKGRGLGDSPDKTFEFPGLFVALILCSQARNNDMLDKEIIVRLNGSESVLLLLSRNMRPLAEKFPVAAILKEAFTSDECLSSIRKQHDNIFLAFQKYALRACDLPHTLDMTHMADMLHDARLQEEHALEKTKQLFREVRKGTINGRENRSQNVSASKYDEPISNDEFTYPEFAEACCRIGFKKFYRVPEEDSSDNGLDMQTLIIEAFKRGIAACADTVNIPIIVPKK